MDKDDQFADWLRNLPPEEIADGNRLEVDLGENAERKTIKTQDGQTIIYDERNAALSKAIIDEIDQTLADHYGFSDEELDFIINYDIKYRMGLQEGVGDDDAG